MLSLPYLRLGAGGVGVITNRRAARWVVGGPAVREGLLCEADAPAVPLTLRYTDPALTGRAPAVCSGFLSEAAAPKFECPVYQLLGSRRANALRRHGVPSR